MVAWKQVFMSARSLRPRRSEAKPSHWLWLLILVVAAGCADHIPMAPDDSAVFSRGQNDRPRTVEDLSVGRTTETSIDLHWTEVNDGAGDAADYEVYHRVPGEGWGNASPVVSGSCAAPVRGTSAGSSLTCTVEDLEPDTSHEFRVRAFRQDGHRNVYGRNSDTASGETAAAQEEEEAKDEEETEGEKEEDEEEENEEEEQTEGDEKEDKGDEEEEKTSRPGTVADLRTSGATSSSVDLDFTEVNDGTGEPAYYRVRFAKTSTNPSWPDDFTMVEDGACANPVEGVEIGATYGCTVPDLESGTEYVFGVIAYRYDESGSRLFGDPSNRPTGETEARDTSLSTGTAGSGLWIDPDRLASLPTSGSAWDGLKNAADRSCPSFDLADQNNRNNTCVMAKALVYSRTGDVSYLPEIVEALEALATMGTYDGRALAMGRNLGAYAIAADLVGLSSLDAALDDAVRAKFRELLTTSTHGAASSLVDCHERRPNNWGTHCGGARAAVAVYLGDENELARTAQVFRGFVGDRSSYSGFTFGGPYGSRDHSWECDPDRPVGINPVGCRKDGRNLDGVIPDDQRRGGSFDPDDWPPPKELYVWEALQGIMMQAIILTEAGYRPFEWEDRAILRTVRWLHDEADFPADRGNTWQPHVVNHYYGTSFPAPTPSRHGKNVGWTDWTHR